MKTVKNNTLGFDLNVEVPSTIDEAVKIFGGESAVVDVINAQELYHGWNGVFADKFCTALEKESGVKRPVKKTIPAVLNEDGSVKTKEKVILESPTNFVKHVIEETKKPLADWEALAESIAATVKYGEGGGSGIGRIGKTYLDTAESILKLDDAQLNNVVAKLEEFNPGIVIDKDGNGRPTQDSLARALKQDQVNQEAARKARLGL